MQPEERIILNRIKELEGAITKGREYLESGANANWIGFQPLFVKKIKDGKALSPHRDWVKNVFLPRQERLLNETERLLERLPERKARRG
jgi:hypothetical protein